MAEPTMDEFLKDNHDGILAAVQAHMGGDETMQRVAAHSELSENDLSGQVLGFWLQGIRSDLTLGSTATMEQNLQWLVRLRAGQEIPFDDPMVMSMFDQISDEIEARLTSEALRQEYVAYREKVGKLIIDAFPA